MGSLCSNASRSIPRVVQKNSNTPRTSQLQVPKLQPKVAKQDANSTTLSVPCKNRLATLSNQPGSGSIAEITKNAAGVAIGNAVGTKISNMLNGKKDVEETVESSMESDFKNEELIEDDSNGQDKENYNSDGEDKENDNDSDQQQ